MVLGLHGDKVLHGNVADVDAVVRPLAEELRVWRKHKGTRGEGSATAAHAQATEKGSRGRKRTFTSLARDMVDVGEGCGHEWRA